MKEYVRPVFTCVEIRAEERLAGCRAVGSCTDAQIIQYGILTVS